MVSVAQQELCPFKQLHSARSGASGLASGMRQLAGTRNEIPEGSRRSARQYHFFPREVYWSTNTNQEI